MAQLDIKDAKGTYDSFITLVKWGAGAVAIITMLVVLIIS